MFSHNSNQLFTRIKSNKVEHVPNVSLFPMIDVRICSCTFATKSAASKFICLFWLRQQFKLKSDTLLVKRNLAVDSETSIERMAVF